MKRTGNPFDSLDINYPRARYGDGSIKQKAFFENGSYESGLIPFEERIKILTKLVSEGYDLHELVNNYLEDKDALDDDTRKHCIASTFQAYADEIFLEPDTEDWREAAAKLLIGDESKTSSEVMRDAIDKFIKRIDNGEMENLTNMATKDLRLKKRLEQRARNTKKYVGNPSVTWEEKLKTLAKSYPVTPDTYFKKQSLKK